MAIFYTICCILSIGKLLQDGKQQRNHLIDRTFSQMYPGYLWFPFVVQPCMADGHKLSDGIAGRFYKFCSVIVALEEDIQGINHELLPNSSRLPVKTLNTIE